MRLEVMQPGGGQHGKNGARYGAPRSVPDGEAARAPASEACGRVPLQARALAPDLLNLAEGGTQVV